MGSSQSFGLKKESVDLVEERLRSRPLGRAAGDSTITQVIFYDAATLLFARTWQEGAPDDRWAFGVTDDGARLMYYVCMRLQQMGTAAAQVLITTKGAPGAFWVATDEAPADGVGVVGSAPGNTSPTDFGTTLSSFLAPKPTLTLLSDEVAADDDGTTLLRTLSLMLSGYAVASDQAVTRKDDGTAETEGDIDAGSPPDGTVTTERPGGDVQTFPLDPLPWST